MKHQLLTPHSLRKKFYTTYDFCFQVGSSYSAEDLALQTVKYGAKHVICTYRTKPMGFKWPSTIEERPIFTHVVGKTVHFSDGTTAEIDAIMFCTGKLVHSI